MAGVASLGKSVTIKGQIVSREDLTIEGDVEGDIDLKGHSLTVGPTGTLRSGIIAREVVIFGTVHGKIDAADKIEIRSKATLIGDIRTARVMIDDGAYFKGAVDIVRKDPPA
jgi:cytoskeletal protein CcmA (bactofilin family)